MERLFRNIFFAETDAKRSNERIKDKELLSDFVRIELTGTDASGVDTKYLKPLSEDLIKALNLRKRYMFRSWQYFPEITSRFLQKPEEPTIINLEKELMLEISMEKGVVHLKDKTKHTELNLVYPDRFSFIADHNFMFKLINDGPLRSFCNTRLCFLSSKFNMHVLMNNMKESGVQKGLSLTDFRRAIKVDTHIHAAGCINQNDLFEFVSKKFHDERPVYENDDGQEMKLAEVFREELGLDVDALNTDLLAVHADRHTFQDFNSFNDKFNPFGHSKLREIFFKTDNYIKGKYFAEIIKIAMKKSAVGQRTEYRLSIYGRRRDEWTNLATWAAQNHMNCHNVQWIIQVPRLYHVYKANAKLKNREYNFQNMLENIFEPLFEVTRDPKSNKVLSQFLKFVSGIDSVDDESLSENITFTENSPTPDEWTRDENPPYTYYLYYMYANLAVLNHFRSLRRMHTLSLRPHCGEAGNASHLIAGFLFAESIAHGLKLSEVPALEYLYYLSQIGIAMSPMSNNALFVKYQFNPLPEYFSRGLNISLSTDDPMQFHYTMEPLIEEFSTASKTWNLSSCDICEIARNGVIQSGFEKRRKIIWLGTDYTKEGIEGNDPTISNVPSIRVAYRYETLVNELTIITRSCQRLETSGLGTQYTLTSSSTLVGGGDVSCLCFAAADVQFEHVRDTAIHEETENGSVEPPQLPTLHVNGTTLTGTLVIARFLATQFGFFGSNYMERAQIDEIITKLSDVTVWFTKTKLSENEMKGTLAYLNGKLKENPIKSGFIVGAKLSVADLTIFSFINRFKLQKQLEKGIDQLFIKIGDIQSIKTM